MTLPVVLLWPLSGLAAFLMLMIYSEQRGFRRSNSAWNDILAGILFMLCGPAALVIVAGALSLLWIFDD